MGLLWRIKEHPYGHVKILRISKYIFYHFSRPHKWVYVVENVADGV